MSGGQTFLLPDLGEGLTEAQVVSWSVSVGDVIAVDQAVAEVETAKAVVEVPSPYAGQVTTLHVAAGETLAVGRPLITITPAAAAPAAAAPSAPGAADSRAVPGSAAAPDAAAGPAAAVYREEERAGSGNVLIGYGTSAGTPGRRRRPRSQHSPAGNPGQAGNPGLAAGSPAGDPSPAGDARPAGGSPALNGSAGPVRVTSPLVRRLAREHGVELRRLAAAAPHAAVTRAQVQAAIDQAAIDKAADGRAPIGQAAASAATAVPAADAGERRIPLGSFRAAAAAALSRSRAEIPEATVWVDVDATPLWELRESLRAPSGPGPGLLAFLARFAVAGLRAYPVLNARFDAGRQEIVQYDRIDLGIAVQGDRGLVAPAVTDAGSLTTAGLDTAIRSLTARARAGRSTPAELAAGTFTLNNYGSFGVDGSAAIINYPQVAILGFGRVIDRPWAFNGGISLRKITQMSFVFDHRVCDGATAAGFMRTVADAIENPAAAIVRL